MAWERARTKVACRVAEIDRQKLTDAINNGDYLCAPETTPGKSRVFDLNDLTCLYLFARLTEKGEPARRAGETVCRIRVQLETSPDAERVVLLDGLNGARAALNGDTWDYRQNNFTRETPLMRTAIWHIGAIRERVKINLAEEERTGGEED